MNAIVRSFGLVAIFAVLTTCGGGDSTPAPVVAVSIAPMTAQLHPGDGVGFTASVTGTDDTNVTWTVQEGAAGGSVDSNGVYTADLANGTFHVIATSVVDMNKSATATITVSGPFVVTPSSDSLGPSGIRAFTANGKVTWSVQEGAAGGAITADGQYTAPSTIGLFHVVATGVQDPSKTMIANVSVVSSGFLTTGNMSTGRTGHTATLLQNGKVLVAGGDGCYYDSYYYPDACIQDSAETFDPGTDTFSATGKMAVKRAFHTATLLSTGKVLVTGGPDASAELYDPTSGTFTATGSMSVGRSAQTATLLANGKVLIVGGLSISGELATAELYDPASGTFTATGAMTTPRTGHSATLMADGRVLIVGGSNPKGIEKTSEVYDPTTGIFSFAASMAITRSNHAATLLANSNVLVTGGDDNAGALSSAEVYDSVSGHFTVTGQMATARAAHVAILLANGAVLVAGPDTPADLYDTTSGLFTRTGGLIAARQYAAAVLLQDGRVLVTGGYDSNTAELYK